MPTDLEDDICRLSASGVSVEAIAHNVGLPLDRVRAILDDYLAHPRSLGTFVVTAKRT